MTDEPPDQTSGSHSHGRVARNAGIYFIAQIVSWLVTFATLSIIPRALGKTGVGQLSPLATWWTEIQTPDPSTIVLTSDQPRPGVFDFFEYFNIVDPVAAEGPDGATKPIGSGPSA